MFIRLLVIAAALTYSLSAVAATGPIEQAMSPTDFQAAGLNKLTADELAKLNAWLVDRDSATPATTPMTAASTDTQSSAELAPALTTDKGPPIATRARKGQSENEIKLVESRLIGTFTGWNTGTVFELENGQHWRVLENRPYRADRKVNPLVRIKKGLITWLFKAEGINQPARVERIQ